MTMELAEIQALMTHMTPLELAELHILLNSDTTLWRALPGPQTQAAESLADITGYGGSAGGGKTDLACGLSLTEHVRTVIYRENGTELSGIVDRLTELLGGRKGFNGAEGIWRTITPDGVPRQIDLCSFPNPGDESKQQGKARDLLIFDEAANMRESAVRFVMGWMRSSDPMQRCRALMTFNPPTTAEGRWVIAYFAPWLDRKHQNPAKPGELRYYATIAGKDVEVPNGDTFVLDEEGNPLYDFVAGLYEETDIIRPLSRTFIPARVTDNPFYMGTNYVSVLQGLPEPLRSQMLKGDFMAGVEDDPWQLIPTAWVEAAQSRWADLYPKPPMDSVGVDVARGGKDSTLIARRHGMWFDKPLAYPGSATPDGPTVAGLAMAAMRDGAPIHIDIIGVGASPYDYLNTNRQHVIGVNVSEKSFATDRSGRLRFSNQRSQYLWQMREALDPANNTGICLPPDPKILADFCAFNWTVRASCIYVDSREEVVKRIGRSPDYMSAFMLALIDTPKADYLPNLGKGIQQHMGTAYDPYKNM
jgi:hypothetical protein